LISPTRSAIFPGRGPLIWGARSLSTDPELKYVSVDRLLDQIALSVQAALAAFQYEPDAASTWAHVQTLVTSFLDGYFRSGSLAGTTAAQAYYVRCDRTTMTQDDIDNQRLIVLLGVAPLRAASFTTLKFVQPVGVVAP